MPDLEKVIAKTRDPAHRQALERMRGFNWLGYIAASVQELRLPRPEGDPGEERMMSPSSCSSGGYSETTTSGGTVRWTCGSRTRVGNCHQEHGREGAKPAAATPDRAHRPGSRAERHDRRGRQRRKGHQGLPATRPQAAGRDSGSPSSMCGLAGGETKSLVGSPCSRLSWKMGHQVRRCRRSSSWHGTLPSRSAILDFVRDIERAMGREEETIAKRRTATAARQTVGA